MISSALSRRVALMLVLVLTAASAARAQAPDRQERRAFVTIRVYPSAKLTVDGKATRQSGPRRRFYSPPLEPGKKYSYTFSAEWMPRNNYETYIVTRKVSVQAGKKLTIDMTKADLQKGDVLFIRFVPTPPKIIDAMMKLGSVGKDDVVYDLGCGTGDLVIAAVQKFHAKHGVGIDIKKEQVQKAKANAQQAGVADKVEFRQADVLKVKDLSEATVVMLYMSDELNEQLRPILQKQLKPGARIVSHRFRMGDWKPDKTETVDIGNDIPEEKLIHLWTIQKK